MDKFKKNMEEFKKNLKEAGFTYDFIQQALHYFSEIIEEAELEGISVEDTLHYYNRAGSFTCNSLQSFYNLYNFREDIAKLYTWDINNSLNLNDYFDNIEEFELQVLYTLFYEFFPQEEEEIN